MDWISRILIENKEQCIFDLSNNGVINGLTLLPTCSKFAYPIYANQDYEQDMINNLKEKNPHIIIYSTNYWSYNIDGRNMKDRFPKLDRYILENYKYDLCKYDYCLKSKFNIE
jgi:hypothetical protein